VLHLLTWKLLRKKRIRIFFNKQYFLIENKFCWIRKYWKYSDNALTSPDYECQGRITIYRAGLRYQTYRYCIDISPYRLIPTQYPLWQWSSLLVLTIITTIHQLSHITQTPFYQVMTPFQYCSMVTKQS